MKDNERSLEIKSKSHQERSQQDSVTDSGIRSNSTNDVQILNGVSSLNMEEDLSSSLSIHNKRFSIVPDQWNVNDKVAQAMLGANTMINKSKAASRYSRIPIKCRGEKCAYRDSCYLERLGVTVDEIKDQVCPIETAEIINRFNDYLIEFNVDPENPEQTTMIGFVKELVDCDILIIRAEASIQADGHYLEDRCVGISDSGEAIMNKEISKNFDFKARIEEKKNKVLQLLNATPKDKAGSKLTVSMDPSSYATELLRRVRDAEENGTIDADYEVE